MAGKIKEIRDLFSEHYRAYKSKGKLLKNKSIPPKTQIYIRKVINI